MKTKLTLFLLVVFSSLSAQEFVQVSAGPSYSQQSYYALSNDDVNILANEAWDLAFTTAPNVAGIFYNEAASSSMSGEAPELKLYLAPTNDFADVADLALITDTLYNAETDWENGAFNSVKNEGDPNDYGWGAYDTGTQSIEGSKVYALQLRNNTWRKIFIESMANGVYTLKYAALDGANEKTVTINKADFGNSPLALFSFNTETAVASPANWDLLFTRYRSALDPGDGVVVQYMVTGVLSGPGVLTAEARGVDPLDVDYEPYLDSLDSQLDIIGQDWKFFDLGAFEWVLDPERAFFVKTTENRLWKIVFYGFDGSSTGLFTFEKTDLGLLSSTRSPASNFVDLGVYPNPVMDQMTVAFTLKESQKNLCLYLANALGQVVWQSRASGNAGLNILNLRPEGIAAGFYHLNIGAGGDRITQKVIIR